jgi:hypothetical protein
MGGREGSSVAIVPLGSGEPEPVYGITLCSFPHSHLFYCRRDLVLDPAPSSGSLSIFYAGEDFSCLFYEDLSFPALRFPVFSGSF